MAPKKKGVSFVKVDKISVDSSKQEASTKKSSSSIQKQPKQTAEKKIAEAPPTTTTTAPKSTATAAKTSAPSKSKKAKKETASKINRLAPAAAAGAAAPAGKKGKKANKKYTKADKKKCAPYVALQLRNLPDAFQEPQIRKFLCQFGVPISHCFIQRTKKRAESRGLAYIRFAPQNADQEKLMDVILDECRAMNLGGNTVSAKWVTRTRLMPSRKAADARRAVEYKNKTEGVPLERHDVRHFDWVNKLRNSAQTEAAGNKYLKSIGLDYSFGGFAQQVALLTDDIKKASTAVQKTVKLARLATAIGRKKGFTNHKVMEKALLKKRAKGKAQRVRKAAAKKAKKAISAIAATVAVVQENKNKTSASPATKKVAAKAAGKK